MSDESRASKPEKRAGEKSDGRYHRADPPPRPILLVPRSDPHRSEPKTIGRGDLVHRRFADLAPRRGYRPHPSRLRRLPRDTGRTRSRPLEQRELELASLSHRATESRGEEPDPDAAHAQFRENALSTAGLRVRRLGVVTGDPVSPRRDTRGSAPARSSPVATGADPTRSSAQRTDLVGSVRFVRALDALARARVES